MSDPFNVEQASSRLESTLKTMPESEVLEFCAEFDRRMDESYSWELWGVAYLINGGCSDDSFMDFRGSLIASGKSIFEAAISNPESLMALDKAHLSEMFEEGFVYSGPSAYEALTGEQPVTSVNRRPEPTGLQWEETAESLEQHFPNVWKIYGWEESEVNATPSLKRPWWKFW